MAEIMMSYIFIEKEKCEERKLKNIIQEIVKSTVDNADGKKLVIKMDEKDYEVEYQIKQKRNSECCYLVFVCKERVNIATTLLDKLNNALNQSKDRKYYYLIKDYDGISERYCLALYPKFAKFERLMRQMMYIILTKAYGAQWYVETISDELDGKVKYNSRGNSNLIAVALEHMTLGDIELYLFDKRIPEYQQIIADELSSDNLILMNKEEICQIIERMRPKSLWELNFNDFGNADDWEKQIKEIHDMRNKVAHNKTISKSEFEEKSKKINKLNRKIKNVIEELKKETFAEESSLEIIGDFALRISKYFETLIDSDIYKKFIDSYLERINKYKESELCLNYGKLNSYLSNMRNRVFHEFSTGLNELYINYPNVNVLINVQNEKDILGDRIQQMYRVFRIYHELSQKINNNTDK